MAKSAVNRLLFGIYVEVALKLPSPCLFHLEEFSKSPSLLELLRIWDLRIVMGHRRDLHSKYTKRFVS